MPPPLNKQAGRARIFTGLIIVAGSALLFALSNNPETRLTKGGRAKQSASSITSGDLMLKITEAQTALQEMLNEFHNKSMAVSRLSNSVASQKEIMDQCQVHAESWMPQANSYLTEASASEHQTTKNMLHSMYIHQAGNINKILEIRDRAAAGHEADSIAYERTSLELREIETQINMLRHQISLYGQQLFMEK